MRIVRRLVLPALTVLLVSCEENGSGAQLPLIVVSATLETAPSSIPGSDADDPAFWEHPSDASGNLVIACQKEGGYSVYDVGARTLVDHRPGDVRFNNVAVIEEFPLSGGKADIAVFSDRFADNFGFFAISAEAPYLTSIPNMNGEPLFSGIKGEDTAYGVGAYQDPDDGLFYAIVTQNDRNRVRLVRLFPEGDCIGWESVYRFELTGGQPIHHAEGVVFDPMTRRLYIVQEDVGLYAVEIDRLDPEQESVTLGEDHILFHAGDFDLTADLEGIDWMDDPDSPGWMILSSQGSNRFLVFGRESLKPVAMVHVAVGEGIDGSEECDGLAATVRPWGSHFPGGILIVHDGQDSPNPDFPAERTNFKWVRWDEIRDQLLVLH